MQIILSPTKTQAFSEVSGLQAGQLTVSEPRFLKQTNALAKVLKQYSLKELESLMKISPRIAKHSSKAFESWRLEHKQIIPNETAPAISAYKGISFSGFELENYSSQDFEFANKHINILSGFYGVLSPLDVIRSYRLELGLSWSFEANGRSYRNLYDYWRDDVNDYLAEKLSGGDVLLNLASQEYAKIIDKKRFFMVTVDFKVIKDKKLKTVSVYAKQQRGRLANWIVKNRVEDIAEIKNYRNDGFSYESSLTQSGHILFTKKI